MSNFSFAQQLNTYLRSNYNLQVDLDIDLYPDISTEKLTYKTEICDRLSDFIRLSPASIAKPFVDSVKVKGIECSADSRGSIFFYPDKDNYYLDSQLNETKVSQSEALIYMQAPDHSDRFDFSYLKLICQAILQVRLLIESKQAYKFLIAAADKLVELHDPDFNQFAFKLIGLLKKYAAKPSLKSLDLFNSTMLNNQFDNSKTMFLTADLLSISAVSNKLKTIKQSAGYKLAVNIHSQKLELESPHNLYDEFMSVICDKPLPACVYFLELKHSNDLDWDHISTDNWLNLNYALQALFERDKAGACEDESLKFNFVLNNLALTLIRARNKGESLTLVQNLRYLANQGHKLLNQGLNLKYIDSNSGYALLRDLSNIIR